VVAGARYELEKKRWSPACDTSPDYSRSLTMPPRWPPQKRPANPAGALFSANQFAQGSEPPSHSCFGSG
jgi:hypothetical protein